MTTTKHLTILRTKIIHTYQKAHWNHHVIVFQGTVSTNLARERERLKLVQGQITRLYTSMIITSKYWTFRNHRNVLTTFIKNWVWNFNWNPLITVRSANSKLELSQLLFISVRQRELVKSSHWIGLSTYTSVTWSVHYFPILPCDLVMCDVTGDHDCDVTVWCDTVTPCVT